MFYFGVVRLKEVSIQKPKHTDNSKPNKYSYLNEIHSKHKLKSAKTDITEIDEEYLIEERGRKHKKKNMLPFKPDQENLFSIQSFQMWSNNWPSTRIQIAQRRTSTNFTNC